MNAEIIAVGTEITSGDIQNTNTVFLSKRLTDLGIVVSHQSAVADDAGEITELLNLALLRSGIIIFTGGLGPTPDDLTKETVCKALKLDLFENPESMERIKRFFEARNKEMTENNRKQAMFPAGAIIFENKNGTADGCCIENGSQCIILLPGPPNEMEPMFNSGVVPYLTNRLEGNYATRTLKVFGVGESEITQRFEPLFKANDPVVATYVGDGDIRIKITSRVGKKSKCERKCDAVVQKLKEGLGDAVFGEDNITLQESVISLLLEQNLKISTAESCTAGLLSKMITDVSGASGVFEYGISAYANHVKVGTLGVRQDLINRHGVVSEPVAEAMAKGVRRVGNADIGVGITGIAGPDGGTKEKPVGTVCISVYDGITYSTKTIHASGDRERIRRTAAMTALDMVRRMLIVRGERKYQNVTLLGNEDSEIVFETITFDDHIAENSVSENKHLEDTNVSFLSVNDDVDETVDNEQEPVGEKEPWWTLFIPVRGDEVKEIVRKCIVLACVVAVIISGIYIGKYFYKSRKNKEVLNEAKNMFYAVDGSSKNGEFNPRFTELIKVNPDIVGWLKLEGTQTDNPVVQSREDSKYYLNHDFQKNESEYGTLFANPNCRFSPKGLSLNTVIFGHRMKDGSMLAGVKNYKDLEFYKQHPTVEFTPIYVDGSTKWKVFSVFISDTKETTIKSPEGLFNYMKTDFKAEKAYTRFIEECTQRSIIDTGVKADSGDKLLTLSTCTYEFDNARLVLVARQVRENEDETVDVSKAKYNPDTVYPTAYYEATGESGADTVSHQLDDFGGVSSTSSKREPPSWMSEVSDINNGSSTPYVPSSPDTSSQREFGGSSSSVQSTAPHEPADTETTSVAPAQSTAPPADTTPHDELPAEDANQPKEFGG